MGHYYHPLVLARTVTATPVGILRGAAVSDIHDAGFSTPWVNL
jgi:hypothetical protein